MKRNVELEAAEALLDAGILLPLLRIRLPRRHEWVLRVTMRRPCLGGQMRIVRHYLKLGITAQQWAAFSEDEERIFFRQHAKRLSLMLALTIRLYERYGSLDLDEILTQAKEEEKT